MPAPHNRFKADIKSGSVQIGCWAGMADAYATEMLGTAGFDWILIDGEHAPNDLRTIMAQLQALATSSSSPVVRIPVGNEALIKQILDIGAQSILIPMIESAEQADAMVRAVRYAPRGRRGIGAALARASNFSTIKDYIQTADEQIALLLQVENRAGIVALDEILEIEGIDGIFIGPADLAADMGHPGNPGHEDVRLVVLDALKKIKASDKAAGILTTDEAFNRQCIDMGVEFTAVGIDVLEYVGAMRALAAKYKSNK